MHTLQVFDLSENENLTRLPSGVSKLVSLQHLNLSRTGVRDLSVELKALVKLIYLNLERMNNLVFIPHHRNGRMVESVRVGGPIVSSRFSSLLQTRVIYNISKLA